MAAKAWGLTRSYSVPTAFAALFFVATFFLGNQSLCIFKATYGIPCPGCGMTRAFLHLGRGDIRGAFYYHPLFILPLVAAAVFIFRNKGFAAKVYRSKIFWIFLLVVFLGVWVVRMFLMFPDKPPLDFNRYGLVPVLWRFISGLR